MPVCNANGQTSFEVSWQSRINIVTIDLSVLPQSSDQLTQLSTRNWFLRPILDIEKLNKRFDAVSFYFEVAPYQCYWSYYLFEVMENEIWSYLNEIFDEMLLKNLCPELKVYILWDYVMQMAAGMCGIPVHIRFILWQIKITFFHSAEELLASLRETLQSIKDIPHILKVHPYSLCFTKYALRALLYSDLSSTTKSLMFL